MDKQEVECDCISDPVHICEAIDPDGIYVCTRRKGHKGDHRACSGDNHAMKTWPQGASLKRKADPALAGV